VAVVFIDTSVLCNLLRIPGKAQHQTEVHSDYQSRRDNGDTFVLPMATVIETGNHIEQLGDSLGTERRRCAQSLTEILRSVARGTEPWVLLETSWNQSLLEQFCDGNASQTTPPFVEVATQGALGGGDLAILVERDRYAQRVMGQNVVVWTYDDELAAWA
jgi:hypothetical protein